MVTILICAFILVNAACMFWAYLNFAGDGDHSGLSDAWGCLGAVVILGGLFVFDVAVLVGWLIGKN